MEKLTMGKKKSPSGEAGTVIGEGTTVEGVLNINHRIRVDGLLRGCLTTTDALVVGEEGRVEGELLAVAEAVVNGRVTGKLVASKLVYLGASGEFRGTLETPRLVIEEGAVTQFYSGPVRHTEITPFPGSDLGQGNPNGTPEGEVASGD